MNSASRSVIEAGSIAKPAGMLSKLTRSHCASVRDALAADGFGWMLAVNDQLPAIRSIATVSSDPAFAANKADPAHASSLITDGFAVQNRKAIFDFANEQRIPVIAAWSIFAKSGAICSYGPLQSEQYRRLAGYVDRIAKGAKPSELSIQQPTKFEMVINMKVAKALGLSIPPALLASADELIE